MAKIRQIILHCSDSTFGSSADIRRWHVKERGWRDIGYHFIINNGNLGQGLRLPSMNGAIEVGREIDGNNILDEKEIGAHAHGFNADSIGICLIGKHDFTEKQFISLSRLIQDLKAKFGNLKILGHNAFNPNKTCPNFDVDDFIRDYL